MTEAPSNGVIDLRDLPPVEHNVEPPEALSQTFLGHVDVCARSGYLYLQHKGATSHALDRGSAYHEFQRRFIESLIAQAENSAPPEVAKDILTSVFEEMPQLQVPEPEMDALRVMAFHLADSLWIDPAKVVGVEKMLELEIAGVKIRGKVDLAFVFPEERRAEVWDSKTSWNVQADDDFAKSWQTRFYGLMLLEGIGSDDPVPMGRGIDTVKLREIYPRYGDLRGPEVTLDRQQLNDFKTTVEATIARARHGFDTGKWQAVPGSHCSTCPAPYDCPLPRVLTPHAVLDDPEKLAERWYFLTSEADTAKKKVKAAAENRPERSIPLGGDLELTWVETNRRGLRTGKFDEVKQIIEGAGFDAAEYLSESTGSSFTKRKRAA